MQIIDPLLLVIPDSREHLFALSHGCLNAVHALLDLGGALTFLEGLDPLIQQAFEFCPIGI